MGAGILIDFAFNVGADTRRAAEALVGRKVKMILSAASKNLKSFFHLCTRANASKWCLICISISKNLSQRRCSDVKRLIW
jgi:hypothetical protein